MPQNLEPFVRSAPNIAARKINMIHNARSLSMMLQENALNVRSAPKQSCKVIAIKVCEQCYLEALIPCTNASLRRIMKRCYIVPRLDTAHKIRLVALSVILSSFQCSSIPPQLTLQPLAQCCVPTRQATRISPRIPDPASQSADPWSPDSDSGAEPAQPQSSCFLPESRVG